MILFPAREHVSGVTIENFRSLHQRFRQRWMRMHDLCEVARCRAHFDSEHAFADEFAGTMTDDANAEDAFAFRFDDEFGQAFGPIKCQRATRGGPWKFCDLD